MTTPPESEALTRVGPGTPMGALMREYWIPAARSSEVVSDGDPLRLMLLGEKLIAFRDSTGKVGVMDHRIRSGERVSPVADWRAAYDEGMQQAVRPAAFPLASE